MRVGRWALALVPCALWGDAPPTAGFTHLDPERTGISFANRIDPATVQEFANIMPSGVAAGDIDGDGRVDLYFCSLDGANVLYRNLGEWRFVDQTARAGVACAGQRSLSAAFADLDGDADLDLLVGSRGGPCRLFRNDGSGKFTEDADFPGRKRERATTSIAVADIDGNGSLDVYLSNHRARSFLDSARPLADDPKLQAELAAIRNGGTPSAWFRERFYPAFGGYQEQGEADELLVNDGAGGFTPAGADRFAMPAGDGPPALNGWGLGVQFRDLTGDGAPELYVCNDFHTPDRLWINDGSGRFTLAPPFTQRKMSWFSMAVDFADLDADGDLDFFVTDMLSRDHARRKRQMGDMVTNTPQSDPLGACPQVMQNTLFLNRGDETFAEISAHAGLRASEWTWGAVFSDVDLDGRPDLLVSCGMIHDMMDADVSARISATNPSPEEIRANRVNFPPLKTRNLLFLNRGGLRFEEAGERFGLARREVSGGLVFADLDGDHDLDLVIANTGAPPEIYRNEAAVPRIAVRLRGRAPNTAGIGAVVELHNGAGKVGRQEVVAGGRLTSACDPLVVFPAPDGGGPFDLRVRWRDGRVSTVPGVEPNELHLVDEKTSVPAKPAVAVRPDPLFEDASERLGHRHRENAFDDFALQPLLPNRLSRLGPGASWIDLDGDGDDDVCLGASGGEAPAIYENRGDGSFAPLAGGAGPGPMDGDLTTILGYGAAGEDGLLVCGVSSWENPGVASAIRVFHRGATGGFTMAGAVPGDTNTIGPLAMADVDADGDLDIFAGGRVRRGRYPEPAQSRLVINSAVAAGGEPFEVAALERLGLASGAVFADLDDDGDPDLVVAREWAPPAVLINTGTGFDDVTAAWGLGASSGWWNGVTAGDFDGDGRIDILATNWGTNSKYEGAYGEDSPLRVYYGDLDASGSFDIVEAHRDKFTGKLVPERGLSCSSNAMPFVRRKMPTFAQFGMAELDEIYGDRLARAQVHEARELRHLVLLNRGGRFEAKPLPLEAQLAPAFAAAVADFDGDGRLDAALAQNFFAVQIETPRNDAGRGLLLRGDGRGGFAAVPAGESGVVAWGEGRACAVSDFDRDGRPDLLMTQCDG
ncbi:MAG: VCBS repeat-containing protein [Akkermansiaceae bacterium]|nr:VCBS repeat-containing protein [Akkermansiaceae bacterium]